VRPGVGRARTRTNDYSGETVLRWSPSEALSALAGLHLLDTRLRQEIDLAALIGTGAFKDDQASFGLFGEVALRPVPRIEVTAGARYQRDGQRRVGSIGDARGRFAIDFEETFEAWLPKLALTYAAAEDLRVGAIVQRAYNPGGATIRADTGATDTFGAETLWAYELFARASLMNGRLTARANLFYNDIDDAQRPQVRTVFFPDGTGVLVTDIDNAPAAETYGWKRTSPGGPADASRSRPDSASSARKPSIPWTRLTPSAARSFNERPTSRRRPPSTGGQSTRSVCRSSCATIAAISATTRTAPTDASERQPC
jgi:outer membrane receptor protein involved in Fe transport